MRNLYSWHEQEREGKPDLSDIGTMTFETRGLEGIAFYDEKGETGVVLAVDAPHKSGQKDLLKYTARQFFSCFSSLGMQAMPK